MAAKHQDSDESIPDVAKTHKGWHASIPRRDEFGRPPPAGGDMPSINELDLPNALKLAILGKRGLFLVSGAPGSGKSSTVAALVDFINRKTSGCMVTIEDDIRFIHRSKSRSVMQPPASHTPASLPAALRAARDWHADLVVIDRANDAETLGAAIELAESGGAVIAVLDSDLAAYGVVEEVVTRCAASIGSDISHRLSRILSAVIRQKVVARKDSAGHVLAIEVVMNEPAIANRIAQGGRLEGIWHMVAESSRTLGRTIEQALCDLYRAGKISLEDAMHGAGSMSYVRLEIKRAGGFTPEDVERNVYGSRDANRTSTDDLEIR